MFDAAAAGGHDPDRVSFVAALRISRQSLAATQGGFPPNRSPRRQARALNSIWQQAISRLLHRLNPER